MTIPFPGQNLASGSKSSGSASEKRSPSFCVTIDFTRIIKYLMEGQGEISHLCGYLNNKMLVLMIHEGNGISEKKIT